MTEPTEDLFCLQTAIIVNDSEQNIKISFSSCVKFSDLLQKIDDDVNEEKQEEIQDSDVAIILYSSGTTGNPKGVQLTYSNLRASALQCLQRDEKRRGQLETKPEHVCEVGPNFCTKKFCPRHSQAIIQNTLLQIKIGNSFMVKLEMALIKYLLQKFNEKFGNHIFLRHMYGLSEVTGVMIAVDPGFENIRKDSIGRLFANLTAKVVNYSTGEILGPNEKGELCFKGPNVMKGYLNNEAATKQVIDTDGFFRSGDLGFYDEDGWFYIVDRIKDIIIVKGYNVSPSEIEKQLLKIDGVADVAVIGIPFKSSEAPRAYVVRNKDSLSEDEIHFYVKNNLAPYKELTGGVEFVKEIPRSAPGKILKKQLLEKYLENLTI